MRRTNIRGEGRGESSDYLQLLCLHSREDLHTMSSFVVILSLAAMVRSAPSGGQTGYAYQTQHCQTKYQVRYEEECHQEYDVVVDTTYTQECQDIVTKHCTKAHVVQHGYWKREAEPSYNSGHYVPVCQDVVERQCREVPQETEREVARQVCSPVEVVVPHQVCGSSHVSVSRSQPGHGSGYGH